MARTVVARIGKAGLAGRCLERIGMAGIGSAGMVRFFMDRIQRNGKAGKDMNKYQFKTPGLFKGINADEAAQELERIRTKYGSLKPEYVVKESEQKSALLHGCFVWDDESAAEQYRICQARDLIRNITVVVNNEEVSVCVRAFVNVREQPDTLRSYVPISVATNNEDAYKDLLKQSLADMRSFIVKYRNLTELGGVKDEMMKVLEKVF